MLVRKTQFVWHIHPQRVQGDVEALAACCAEAADALTTAQHAPPHRSHALTTWMPQHLACQHIVCGRLAHSRSTSTAQKSHLGTCCSCVDLSNHKAKDVSTSAQCDTRTGQNAAAQVRQQIAVDSGKQAAVAEGLAAVAQFVERSQAALQGLLAQLHSAVDMFAQRCSEGCEQALRALGHVCCAADAMAARPCESTVKLLVRLQLLNELQASLSKSQ